jgi:hypothetical protein
MSRCTHVSRVNHSASPPWLGWQAEVPVEATDVEGLGVEDILGAIEGAAASADVEDQVGRR